MSSLINEFNGKISELEKIVNELDKDFLLVKPAEESLIIEGVVDSLNEAKHQIKKVVMMEELRASKQSA